MTKGFVARYMAKLEANGELFLKSRKCKNGHNYIGTACNTCHYLAILRGDGNHGSNMGKGKRKAKKKHNSS